MTDSINGVLTLNHSNNQLIKTLLDQMQSSHSNHVTGKKTYSGYIENMRIKVNEHGVRFEGSLAKLYHGNNIISLDQRSTKLAIEKFSDLMHLPMHVAKIHRLDVAQNLSMDKPAVSYYPFLGERKFMQRLEQGSGVYYRNTLGERVFYDKTKEQAKSKDAVDPVISGQHLLRFEVRDYGHKNICKRYNVPEVNLGTLCEPSFYRGMVNGWATEYDKIDKYQDLPIFDDDVYRKPSLFCAQVTFKGIQALGGYNGIMTLIKQARLRGVFKTLPQYLTLKRKVKRMGNTPDRSVDNPFLIELNAKVRDFVLLSA